MAVPAIRVIIEEFGREDVIRVEFTYPHLTVVMRDELHPGCYLVFTPARAAELAEKLTEALKLLKVPEEG